MHQPNPGGKATNLLRLQSYGFPVPPFRVVLAGEAPEPILTALCAECPQVARWAVRSSASAEDGKQFSFAGQFLSLLNVAPDALPQAVAAVRASAHSDGVNAYCALHGLPFPPEMAVVIQQMVPATASGVAFGIHPVTGEQGQPVITAVRGLGDRLVSGETDADPDALTPGQQQQVKAALARAESLWSCFLDMEFAFDGDTLYIVQVRPVTAVGTGVSAGSTTAGTRRVWDNSNIIESYPGLTQPLTFSFILRMYEAVYMQLLALFGVPEKILALHCKSVLGHMLGLIRGRVYYNLLSWYQALSLLPGYQLNAAFMEGMMGVKERFEAEKLSAGGKLYGWLGVGRMLWRMVYTLARLPRDTRAFLAHLEHTKAAFRQQPLSALSPDELLAMYDDLEKTLVTRWEPPLVNDFFAMIFFGVLQKQAEKLAPDQHLHNALLAGSRSVLSVAPATELSKIARTLQTQPEACEAFLSLSPAAAWQWLHTPDGAAWLPTIQTYLDAYGDRVSGELKLETRTWQQEPALLIARLQGLTRSEHLGLEGDTESRSAAMRTTAEQQARAALKGKPLKRLFFHQWLRATRYLVANRENLRLERTHTFDMVRQLMTQMGHHWTAAGLLDAAEDIFFLKLEEIQGFVRGTHADVQPRALVALRQESYRMFANETLPERITTFGMVGSWLPENHSSPEVSQEFPTGETRQGIGCCPGRVRGRVRVVRDPASVQDLGGDILVSATTDPGWVALFPTCAAIVVERGSLLSHSAIVSRELGIPCVVAVPGLLSWLRDGDLIELDGRNGIVTRVAADATTLI